MDVIEDVCDRVIIMNDGQIVVDEPVEKLLAGFETRAYRVTARGVGEATLADLRERFDLSNVDRVDGRTRFEVAADTQTFYRLTDAMEAHDLDLAGIESVQPDLAEVFVEVTGGGDGVASQGNGDGEATSSDGGARR
jgi:ABC-2 type transport system ATP-binding protein